MTSITVIREAAGAQADEQQRETNIRIEAAPEQVRE